MVSWRDLPISNVHVALTLCRITNAFWSDNACMAVRTGGPGAAGLSLLMVPLKGHKGVEMRRLKVSGQISAGTTFVELDDVEVPVENLIGEEGKGKTWCLTISANVLLMNCQECCTS